jgi:hypothetical protein
VQTLPSERQQFETLPPTADNWFPIPGQRLGRFTECHRSPCNLPSKGHQFKTPLSQADKYHHIPGQKPGRRSRNVTGVLAISHPNATNSRLAYPRPTNILISTDKSRAGPRNVTTVLAISHPNASTSRHSCQSPTIDSSPHGQTLGGGGDDDDDDDEGFTGSHRSPSRPQPWRPWAAPGPAAGGCTPDSSWCTCQRGRGREIKNLKFSVSCESVPCPCRVGVGSGAFRAQGSVPALWITGLTRKLMDRRKRHIIRYRREAWVSAQGECSPLARAAAIALDLPRDATPRNGPTQPTQPPRLDPKPHEGSNKNPRKERDA